MTTTHPPHDSGDDEDRDVPEWRRGCVRGYQPDTDFDALRARLEKKP